MSHIYKAKVAHMHPCKPTPSNPTGERITHPTLWFWVDEEGTERAYSTKTEAEEARESYSN